MVASRIFLKSAVHHTHGVLLGYYNLDLLAVPLLILSMLYAVSLLCWEGVKCYCLLTVPSTLVLEIHLNLVVCKRPGSDLVLGAAAIEFVTRAVEQFPQLVD